MEKLIFKSESGVEIKEDPAFNKAMIVQGMLLNECSVFKIGSIQFLNAIDIVMQRALSMDLITEIPLYNRFGLLSPVTLKGEIHEVSININFDI